MLTQRAIKIDTLTILSHAVSTLMGANIRGLQSDYGKACQLDILKRISLTNVVDNI